MSPFLEIRKSLAFHKSGIDKIWECNVRCFSITSTISAIKVFNLLLQVCRSLQ